MFLCCMSVIGMAALFSSCTDDNGTPDEPDVDFVGSSIKVPNEVGTYSVQMEFDHNWEVSNKTTWFSITPLSGTPGTATISVTVVDTNPDLIERVASFIIKNTDAGTNTQYYVIQDVTSGFNIADSQMSVGIEEQQAVFTLEGNVDFEAVAAQDWITIDGVESDSTLLADDATYSKYKTYRINMSIAANTGEVRYSDIYLNGVDGTTKDTVTVSQMGELVADYSKTFYRRSMGFRLTATSCGFCPIMAAAMKQAYEETNGRFVPFTIYCLMSSGDEYVLDNWRYWFAFFRAGGWPHGVVNGYANCGNYPQQVQADFYKAITDEAVRELPSNTLIAGSVINNDGSLDIQLSVASKEAGSYTMGVFLLENGVVGWQNSGGNDYEHNFLVRQPISSLEGDPITLSANSTQEFSYNVGVPSSVENIDNCHLCVWIAKEGTFMGSEVLFEGTDEEIPSSKLYLDYNMVIDNVVEIPVNGFAVFEYEN